MDQRPKFLEENTGKHPQDIDVGDSFGTEWAEITKAKLTKLDYIKCGGIFTAREMFIYMKMHPTEWEKYLQATDKRLIKKMYQPLNT